MPTGEKPSVNKFENMTDDEVMDIATTPKVNEVLASEAEAELLRREALAKKEQEPSFDDLTKGPVQTEPVMAQEEEASGPYDEYLDDENASREKIYHRHNNIGSHTRRVAEKIKEEEKAPLYDKRRPEWRETRARNAASYAEAIPEKEEHEYSEAEILGDAEKQIRNHFDDFMIAGLMSDYRTGNSIPNHGELVRNQYGNLLERRAYAYGIDEESDISLEKIKNEAKNQIIDKMIGQKTPEEIQEYERKALLALIEQGARTEVDEFGNKTSYYSIPNDFAPKGPRIARFEKRYGASRGLDPEIFIRNKGIDFEDPKVQNASFHGFFEIANVLKDIEDPDLTKLDWYFDNFKYGDVKTMTRFFESLETSRNVDEKTRVFVANYIEQRPEYQDYLEYLNSPSTIKDEEEKIRDTIDNVELIKGEAAIKRLCDELDLDYEDVMDTVLKNLDGDIFDDTGPFGQFRGNTVIKNGEDVFKAYDLSNPDLKNEFDAEEYQKHLDEARKRKPRENETYDDNGSERLGADYAKKKIIFMAIMYGRIRKIDPDAEIGFPSKDLDDENDENKILQDKDYLIIRFGCESTHRNENGELVTARYNHVIAESTSIVGATYLWYGHGDDWREDLSGTKMSSLEHPNVDRKTHNPKESLLYHHNAALYKLGIMPGQILPAA